MGGSVFAEHTATVRIDRAEHDAIAARAAAALAPLGVYAKAVPSLRDKTSFGDVDLITARSQTHAGLPEEGNEHTRALAARDAEIADALGADAYYRDHPHNPALHMLVAGLHGAVQLDLMSIEDHLLNFATRHLSWNDAGAMAASIAQQMGLKFGMHGVALIVPVGGVRRRVELSMDYDQALGILGLDADDHRAGFDAIEDVYAWLARGRYFNPCLWSRDWMTNKRRHRAMKRDSYAGIGGWLARERPEPRYDWGEHRGARTDEWTEILLETHPEARAELHRLRTERAAPQGLRAFFNGEVVRRHIDVDDEAMQHVINGIRKRIGPAELQRLADQGDADALDEHIREYVAEALASS